MKKLALSFFSISLVISSYSQTVFTYGNKSVSKEEFLRAFNKNPNPSANRKQALNEYLDLYINYKLKVQAAYDIKLHEDPAQQEELDNFKNQIAENTLNEKSKIDDLLKEAFARSQKDLQVQQVFVEVPSGGDTLTAYRKIQLAYNALQTGKNFTSVATEFSTDGSTGELGFITVFTLPYEFENVAYNLKPGSYSAPFKSRLGYHIFKNLQERPAAGTVKLSQILIATPSAASSTQLQNAQSVADSVYNLVLAGAPFETLANTVSSSSSENSQLAEVAIGEYNAEFEQAAFNLKTPGEISKPVRTEYGYHILKLLEKKPVIANYNDALSLGGLKEKVMADTRMANAKKDYIKKQLGLLKYKPAMYNAGNLLRYTDSVLSGSNVTSIDGLNDETILFSFAKQKITVNDWIQFVEEVREAPSVLSRMPLSDLMKEFVLYAAAENYKSNLNDYDASFKQQVQEFKEANMLFAIMDAKVWSHANSDTTGLYDFYLKNKAKYQWAPSADALIIVSTNQQVAEDVKQKIKPDFSNWRSVVELYNGTVTADSGRYELKQLPVVEKTNFSAGIVTAPVKNDADGSFTFNYIIKVYKEIEPRNFEDARGMAISDYQQVLEDKWLSELKKKYPVKVNKGTLNL